MRFIEQIGNNLFTFLRKVLPSSAGFQRNGRVPEDVYSSTNLRVVITQNCHSLHFLYTYFLQSSVHQHSSTSLVSIFIVFVVSAMTLTFVATCDAKKCNLMLIRINIEALSCNHCCR